MGCGRGDVSRELLDGDSGCQKFNNVGLGGGQSGEWTSDNGLFKFSQGGRGYDWDPKRKGREWTFTQFLLRTLRSVTKKESLGAKRVDVLPSPPPPFHSYQHLLPSYLEPE